MRILLSFLVILCLLSSCSTSKNVYFHQQPNSNFRIQDTVPENRIQANDLLGITVSSLNQEASSIFIQPQLMDQNNSQTGNSPNGYLVTADGTIQFPVLGTLRVLNKTTAEVRKQIMDSLIQLQILRNPTVSVRFLNFRISVLGEVGRPMVINVPSEKISLLEALGMAGDITIYGKKDNVMLIRESNGNRIVRRVNLVSADFLTSDVYYLQPNDVIYVEPLKSRLAAASTNSRIIPYVLSGLSFVAIILDRVFR